MYPLEIHPCCKAIVHPFLLQSYIAMYWSLTIYLSKDIWADSTFLFMNKTTMNICV